MRILVSCAAVSLLVPAVVFAAPKTKTHKSQTSQAKSHPTQGHRTKAPRRTYLAPVKPTLTKKGAASIKTPVLPKADAVRPESLKPLKQTEAERILRDLGIENPSKGGTPTTLTVRKPFAHAGAFMAFVGAAWVNPAEAPVGVAVLESNKEWRRGNPASTLPGPRINGRRVTTAAEREFAQALQSNVGLAIEFTAKRSHDHVVECAWESRYKPRTEPPYLPLTKPDDFHTRVSVDGKELTGGTAVFGNRVLQAVPVSRNDTKVVVRVMAAMGFTATQCTITAFPATPPKGKRKARPRHSKHAP